MLSTSEMTAISGVLPGSPRLSEVTAHDGTTWRDYRKRLRPHYQVAWRDIAICHALIVAGYVIALLTEHQCSAIWAVAWLPPVTLWIAFWLHALLGFGHEAAHNNLAVSRKWNDRLANLFVWSLFGQSVAQYRRVHWQHHLHLGDVNDSEISYHQCLSPSFLVKLLTGWHLIVAFKRHLRAHGSVVPRGDGVGALDRAGRNLIDRLPMLVSLSVHAASTAVPWLLGFPVTALAWSIAVLVFFPCIATVRQLLEHRKIEARCEQDFRHELHGAVNRLFGTGLFARSFGSAGFNRHLLHHWDPAISYTRFDEMEAFFLKTKLAKELDAHRTIYLKMIFQLIKDARRG